MTYRGLRSWPPAWTWINGEDNQYPKGEVGVLKEIKLSQIQRMNRIFLYMEYKDAAYIGYLLIDHHAFCRQIARLLEGSCGRPLWEIGAMDLSRTL